MAGTPRVRTDQQLSDDYGRLSTGGRVASNVLDAIALMANSGTVGLGGRAVDLIQGNPWGTADREARFRLDNSGPHGALAGTAGDVVGALVGGKAAWAGARAAPGLIRSALSAAPTIGTRAAALGATSPSYVGTAAKILGPAAAALGIGSLLNRSATDAIVTPAAAKDPVADALGQGRTAAATPMTSQEALDSIIAQALSGQVPNSGQLSLTDIQALGGLIPTATKLTQTNKDKRVGIAGDVADKTYARQIDEAKKMPAGDARDKAIQKATNSYYTASAILSGVNPEGLATQQQYSEREEEP